MSSSAPDAPPQGKLLGQLAPLTATQLGGRAIAAAIESAGILPTDIDQVIMGQVVQSNSGQNPARQAAVEAGISLDVPALTVNSVCLSGLRAITDAARLIRLGEAQVVVAGGQESMSNAPHLLPGARKGVSYGSINSMDSLERDALTDAFDQQSMGVNTDEGTDAVPLIKNPISFSRSEVTYHKAPPALGQDGQSVRDWISSTAPFAPPATAASAASTSFVNARS